MVDDDTVKEIQKLIKAYGIDSYRMESLAEDIISDHKKQTQKGLPDIVEK